MVSQFCINMCMLYIFCDGLFSQLAGAVPEGSHLREQRGVGSDEWSGFPPGFEQHMLENVMFFPEKNAPDKQLILAKNDALENILSFPCCDGPPFSWTKCLFFF